MRSQTSMEFLFMLSIVMFLSIIFLVIFSELYQDNIDDKKRIVFRDFMSSLKREFLLAASFKEGYHRTFEIPTSLEGFTYEIYIKNREYLIINYSGNILSDKIPYTVGDIQKGKNKIEKRPNYLCLNC